jgi:hypothetical protein
LCRSISFLRLRNHLRAPVHQLKFDTWAFLHRKWRDTVRLRSCDVTQVVAVNGHMRRGLRTRLVVWIRGYHYTALGDLARLVLRIVVVLVCNRVHSRVRIVMAVKRGGLWGRILLILVVSLMHAIKLIAIKLGMVLGSRKNFCTIRGTACLNGLLAT